MIKRVKTPIPNQDVVFTNNVDPLKLYATCVNKVVYVLERVGQNGYTFVNVVNKSEKFLSQTCYSVTGCIEEMLNCNFIVYQFDTQEEFFKWALEQTTDKKFKTINVVNNSRFVTIHCLEDTIEVFA